VFHYFGCFPFIINGIWFFQVPIQVEGLFKWQHQNIYDDASNDFDHSTIYSGKQIGFDQHPAGGHPGLYRPEHTALCFSSVTGFYAAVAQGIEEAAEIDGASPWESTVLLSCRSQNRHWPPSRFFPPWGLGMICVGDDHF
jgi:hypothetical protein